jgi:predicted  nucleic acid-binding Zn-ribbon protein
MIHESDDEQQSQRVFVKIQMDDGLYKIRRSLAHLCLKLDNSTKDIEQGLVFTRRLYDELKNLGQMHEHLEEKYLKAQENLINVNKRRWSENRLSGNTYRMIVGSSVMKELDILVLERNTLVMDLKNLRCKIDKKEDEISQATAELLQKLSLRGQLREEKLALEKELLMK